MTTRRNRILTFNCGSSSLKFELLELGASGRERRMIARGKFEAFGRSAQVSLQFAGSPTASRVERVDHHAGAAERALQWLRSANEDFIKRLDAVVHRIVHGGERVEAPAFVNAQTIRAIEAVTELAPAHNRPALDTIKTVGRSLRAVPAVVVPDTWFHRTIPPHAKTYAIPPKLARRHGIRRFGFHGIAHACMADRYARITGATLSSLDLITLHLGSGCSAAAIRGGRSIDTSMGFTPLEGLMMAKRSGDLDPSIIPYLMTAEGLSAVDIERVLNNQSGLLGASGISADMRVLEEAAAAGNAPARLAIDMFCYRVRKYIGAYLAALGGAKAIIFGGGIGENSTLVRAQICAGLECFGVRLDRRLNKLAGGNERRISRSNSPVRVYVITVDEELYMARAAQRLLAAGPRRSLSPRR